MPPNLYAAVKLTLKTKGTLPSGGTKEELLQEAANLLNNYFQPFLAGDFIADNSALKGLLMVQETPRIIQLIQLIDLEMDPVR